MGNFKSKEYTFIKESKFATENELTNTDFLPYPLHNLQRFTVSGDTFHEALENLKDLCYKNGIPKPELYYGCYCCGTIDILYFLKVKKRLNPVFQKERNGRYFAIIYYPRL